MPTREPHPATFQWSLKPLLLIGNLIGLPFDVPESKRRRRFPDAVRIVLVATFCCSVLMANLGINGSKLYDFRKLKQKLGNIDQFDSGFSYFMAKPTGLVILVKDLLKRWFFVAVPLVHLLFSVIILLPRNWTDLWTILETIQRKMKLDAKFHRTCRKFCLVALLFLFAVGLILNI